MLRLKGDDFEWKKDLTVREMMEDLRARGKYRAAMESPGMMVLINGKLVTREHYSSTTISKNDVIHLVTPVMGG